MKKHLISLVALSAMMLVGCDKLSPTSSTSSATSTSSVTQTSSEASSTQASTETSSTEKTSSSEDTSSVADSSVVSSSEVTSSSEESSVEDSSTVSTIDVTSVTLDAESGSLYVGQKATLKATVAPENATDKTVTWASSDQTVATVENGVVTAVGKGNATITATAGSKSATYALTVNDFSDLPNAFYDEGIINDGESTGAAGHMIYWFGEGAAVSNIERAEGTNEYSMTYTAGGQWWATQLFYKGLYQEAGDSYVVSLDLTSSVAGNITVAGQVLTMAANTTQTFIYDVKDTATLISIQLGENGKSVLGSGTFKMKVNGIYDTTADAKYHGVEFKVDGKVIKNLPVKDGKTVAAPADPTPDEGKIFDGWYNGETKWTETTTIIENTTFEAKFSDANTAHTVTLYNGSTVLGTVSVSNNNTVVLPDNIVYPFGYSAGKWYIDEGLTQEYDFTTAVTADLNLYARLYITPTATFDGYNGWNPINSSALTNEEDGSLTLNYAAGLTVNYQLQVNFTLPIGEAGKSYKVTAVSKISATGGDVQIYDTATIGELHQLGVNGTDYETTELIYQGGTLSAANKLTFELGAISNANGDTFSFNLKSLKVEEYVPGPELKAEATATNLTVGGESATVTLTASNFSAAATYNAVTRATDIIDITNNNDGTFTIAPKAAGSAVVTFSATAGEESATAEVTFTVKEAPVTVDSITATSGSLEGAQIWLKGLDNTILGVTGENLSTTTIEATFNVTSKDNSVPADFLGENPISAVNHTWQDLTTDTVTLYVAFDKGFNTNDWDFELDCSIKVTTATGTYTVKGKFHNKEYVIGDVVYTPSLTAKATTTTMKMGDDAATVTLTSKYFTGDVAYSAVAATADIVTITNNNNGTFTIAPKAVGTTIVTFTAASAAGETATAELTFEVKEAPTSVQAITATSGRLEGAQFWLEGLDNTKLGITGENLSTATVTATITTSTSDSTIPEAYVGKDKIKVTSSTWQAITTDTVTLYCAMNMGLDSTWDITWNISVAIDAPNGSFSLAAKFVKTTFTA